MSHRPPHRVEPRHRAAPAILSGLLAAAVLPGPSFAASKTGLALPGQIPKSPPFAAGFPIPFHRTVDYRPAEGAVVADDLDRDGRIDLVVSLPAGLLTVIHADGSLAPGWPRWFDRLPQPAYPLGAPGVGDLDGDGFPEIVTCVVSGETPRHSFLYAFTADGRDLPGWPVEIGSTGSDYDSCSPAGVLMADLDGDGRMEVLRGMSDGSVVALSGDGTPVPGWPVRLGPDSLGRLRGVNADLAAADLDGDGCAEVLFVESGLEPRLVAVSGHGRIMPGFPQVLPEVVDQQAPAVADLDGDGRPEVVQATLPFTGNFLETSAPLGSPGSIVPDVPAALHVLRADGSPFPGWPRGLASGGAWGSVLADLNGDGHPDILQQDGDLLYAFDAWGSILPRFPYPIHRDFLRSDATRVTPWIVADLDGDSAPEMLQARSDVYAGSAYLRVFALRDGGQPVKGFPFEVAGLVAASRPVAVDLTADGVKDLVMLAIEGTTGGYSLLAWDLGRLARGSKP